LVKELGADVYVNRATPDGATVLRLAAYNNNVDMVRCLGKELGADVNKVGLGGSKALLHAASFGFMDIVQCLVNDLGADVNQANVEGFTPLIGAVYTESKHMCGAVASCRRWRKRAHAILKWRDTLGHS
jgi:ankyrin repeat protein